MRLGMGFCQHAYAPLEMHQHRPTEPHGDSWSWGSWSSPHKLCTPLHVCKSTSTKECIVFFRILQYGFQDSSPISKASPQMEQMIGCLGATQITASTLEREEN